MADEIQMLNLLVASPGDTADERHAVREVIDYVNKDHGAREGYLLVPLMWETDAAPGVGSYSQDVINRDLERYDIFVGLMGARFGSPTKRANSGTEEEFGNAFEKFLNDSSSVRILFYFKNAYVSVHDLEGLVQGLRVCQFMRHLEQLGVFYQKYESRNDLAQKLRTDLPRRVKELISARNAPTAPSSQKKIEYETVGTVERGNWIGAASKRYPQGASYLDLTLSEYPPDGRALARSVRGKFISKSPYFRFGFKLLPLDANPFGEGSIQTDGPNVVVHLAKDHDTGLLYLTTYHNGRRIEPFRRDLFPYRGEREIDIELILVRDGAAQLQLDCTSVWEEYVTSNVQERVLVLGWGDYFDYEVGFNQISIQFRRGK